MNLNIIGKRKIFFTISIVAMALVLLVTIFVGPTLDIEFKGGSIATYSYTGEVDPAGFERRWNRRWDKLLPFSSRKTALPVRQTWLSA